MFASTFDQRLRVPGQGAHRPSVLESCLFLLAAVLTMPSYFDLHPVRVTSVFHDLGVQQWRLEQRMLGIEVKVPKSKVPEPDEQADEISEEG